MRDDLEREVKEQCWLVYLGLTQLLNECDISCSAVVWFTLA